MSIFPDNRPFDIEHFFQKLVKFIIVQNENIVGKNYEHLGGNNIYSIYIIFLRKISLLFNVELTSSFFFDTYLSPL